MGDTRGVTTTLWYLLLVALLVLSHARAQSDPLPPWQAYRLTADKTEVPNAQCLDGSPPLYYHSPGFGDGVNRWEVHMEGGAWCGSAEECYGWWGYRSTYADPDTLPEDTQAQCGYFNRTAPTNLMKNWNFVFIRYCDGYSFSSNRDQPTVINVKNASGSFNVSIHSRGLSVLQAVQQDLLKFRGMGSATDVVVGGCSAGGMAVYMHCDSWALAIGAVSPSTKVRCLADSGWFPIIPANLPLPSTWFNGVWQNAFSFHNSSAAIAIAHPQCLVDHAPGGAQWQCSMAQVSASYTRTPLFMYNSRYDSFQIFNMERCIPMPPDPKSPCNASTVTLWGEFITQDIRAWLASPLAVASGHAAFVTSCYAHCGTWATFDQVRSYNLGNLTGSQAFAGWYSASTPTSQLFLQDVPYPCSDCCAPHAPDSLSSPIGPRAHP